MSGELSTRYLKKMIVVEENEVPYTRCPLHWGISNKIGFSCNHKFGNWLVGSIAAHYVLFDVFTGVGTFDLRAFPPELDNSTVFREILDRSVKSWLALDESE